MRDSKYYASYDLEACNSVEVCGHAGSYCNYEVNASINSLGEKAMCVCGNFIWTVGRHFDHFGTVVSICIGDNPCQEINLRFENCGDVLPDTRLMREMCQVIKHWRHNDDI